MPRGGACWIYPSLEILGVIMNDPDVSINGAIVGSNASAPNSDQ